MPLKVLEWADEPPPSAELPRGVKPIGRDFYDDPRFDHPEEDEYADVIPVPFYPDDLPVLQTDEFHWTDSELAEASHIAKRWREMPAQLSRKEAQHDRYCP